MICAGFGDHVSRQATPPEGRFAYEDRPQDFCLAIVRNVETDCRPVHIREAMRINEPALLVKRAQGRFAHVVERLDVLLPIVLVLVDVRK